MNKIMKIVAASLCLALAITTLSACSSTGNNKPSEESSKPAEEVTTIEEITEEPAQEPAETTEAPTTAEPDTVESGEEVIIPLYDTSFESDVRNVKPLELHHLDTYMTYFPLTQLEETYMGSRALYSFEYGENFKLKLQPIANDPTTYDVRVLVTTSDGTNDFGYVSVSTYIEINGVNHDFKTVIPLLYNQTKGCIVGYAVTDDSWALYEYYYYEGSICAQLVEDTSIYGL